MRRRLAADRCLHLRAGWSLLAPACRHSHEHAGAFERGHVPQELHRLLWSPAQRVKNFARIGTPSDNVALTRIDDRIDTAVNDLRHRLDEEIGQLLRQLEGQNFTEVLNGLAGVDSLYDEFNQKMDLIRADMLGQVHRAPQRLSAISSEPFGFRQL